MMCDIYDDNQVIIDYWTSHYEPLGLGNRFEHDGKVYRIHSYIFIVNDNPMYRTDGISLWTNKAQTTFSAVRSENLDVPIFADWVLCVEV